MIEKLKTKSRTEEAQNLEKQQKRTTGLIGNTIMSGKNLVSESRYNSLTLNLTFTSQLLHVYLCELTIFDLIVKIIY